MPWSFIKFFQLIHEGNVWRSVWRICLWILGLKGIADRRIPSNDPRINCGKHFGSSSFLVCERRMCVILQIVLSRVQKLLNILIAYVALPSRTKIFKGLLKSPRSFTQRTRIISTVQSQTITLMKPSQNSSVASRHSALSRSGYRSAGSTRLRVIFGVLYQM